jgi:hypothetical protein
MEAEGNKAANTAQDAPEAPVAPSADAGGKALGGGALRWTLKLILLAAIAAGIGAFVTANWKERPFSVLFAMVQVNAGVVILASVALGFILAVVFLWGAFTRE